jgi:class 3 adenylate cyclase/tetratricopeptide (TPR) repeat protein
MCDMVGSTELSSRLDPEDMAAILDRYLAACAQAVEAEGGFVASTAGDGLLAYFGYPVAQEDAAIRAVRAGLDLVARVSGLPGLPVALQARVGIATGAAVISERADGNPAREDTATGAILALAARLQTVAPPGGVVLPRATRALLGDSFELRSLGEHSLKGFATPEPVWQALREAAAPSRFEALRGGVRSSLIGRGAEMSVLRARWRRACQGAGGTTLLVGEPGIGKSRLVAALRQEVAAPHEVLLLQCSPYHQGSTLYPVIGWIDAAIGAPGTTPPQQRAARLAELAAVTPQALPALGVLLGIEGATEGPGDPVARREAKLAAVTGLLAATPAGQARLVVVEDIHWADESTHEVLGRLAQAAPARRLCLVLTSREVPAEGPLTAAAVTRLALERLSPTEVDVLVAEQDGGERLAPELRRTIAERSGGVPLFAEELARAMLDAGAEGAAATVPLTLHDTLMARLDRLSAGKPVAQLAAVIGREFPAGLLGACARLSAPALRSGIEQLQAAGLVEELPGPEPGFAFRHALVRDVAYESVLRSRRATLHGIVAQTLEAEFPATAEAQPELVARHWTEAGEHATAVPRWHKAAQHALARSAPRDAIRHLQTGLGLLGRLPPDPQRDQQEVKLRTDLALPLSISQGFGTSETVANLQRLSELVELAEPTDTVLRVLWGEAMAALSQGDMTRSRDAGIRLLRTAERAKLPNAWRMPHRILGYTAMIEGRLQEADSHFRRALDGYAPEGLDPIMPAHPFDVLSAGRAQHAIALAMIGRPAEMVEAEAAALARMRALAHYTSSFQVLVHLCAARLEAGDLDDLAPLIAELRGVVERYQIPNMYAELWAGWTEAREGRLEAGLARMRQVQEELPFNRLWLPTFTLQRGVLLHEAGQPDAALAELARAEEELRRFQHTYLLPELLRRRAEVLLPLGAPLAVRETLLREAVAMARRQGAVRQELLAAIALARAVAGAGRLGEARDTLLQALAGVPEEGPAREAAEARGLLAELPAPAAA